MVDDRSHGGGYAAAHASRRSAGPQRNEVSHLAYVFIPQWTFVLILMDCVNGCYSRGMCFCVQAPARPRWNDDAVVEPSSYDDAPPPRAAAPAKRVMSGRRAGQARPPLPDSGPSSADIDPEYLAEVSTRAAPRLTLLKSKIRQSKSRADSFDDDGGFEPAPPARVASGRIPSGAALFPCSLSPFVCYAWDQETGFHPAIVTTFCLICVASSVYNMVS